MVRSIENASKNPVAIEKWIQSVSDLHRSKPPPQVTPHHWCFVELSVVELSFIDLIIVFY